MSTAESQVHTIDPVYDDRSKILILGSFPSVKSREVGFFYGHPQNRFWQVMGSLFDEPVLMDGTADIETKKAFLHAHHIALWDVIASCKITGSSDASITDVVANDIAGLLQQSAIRIVYCNGTTSKKLYEKYIAQKLLQQGIHIHAVCLPSTSPANAAFSRQELISAWARIRTAVDRSDYSTPYYSLNAYLKDAYGRKLYKLSLDGHFTCPNRDGTLGTGGCTFCDGGSGDFAGVPAGTTDADDIASQLQAQKERIATKFRGDATEPSYIAYFQSYTGTYDKVDRLRRLYTEAICDPEVAILSIATRPDCLDEDVVRLLSEMHQRKPVWIELGLQTMHEDTARAIHRGYDRKTYEQAIRKLHRAGISHIITHMIIGLPGESVEDMVETAHYIGQSGASGIKLQLLHVLEGTPMAADFQAGKFDTLELEDYLHILQGCLAALPEDMVVHRLTGDGNKKRLIAPLWSADKKKVLNAIKAYMR